MAIFKSNYWLRPVSILLTANLAACTAGVVNDTAGVAIPDADVVAYGECYYEGCATNQVQTSVPGATLTGYHATTDANGRFFYDPYAVYVAPEDAMTILVPEGAAENYYKLQISKAGYQDIWMDFTPAFELYNYEGEQYYITRVPDTFMCEEGAPDGDGDGICDEAETHYGLSASAADTDGDGVYDDQEIFGTGSPFKASTRELIHYNINVSNFEASKAFYEMLGARVLLETDVDVTDPAEAQGLDLPPYQLHAAPMVFSDGFIIDLIQFASPYDPEPPHSEPYSANGMTQFAMESENLAADIANLGAAGISYTVTDTYPNGDPRSIELATRMDCPSRYRRMARSMPIRTMDTALLIS